MFKLDGKGVVPCNALVEGVKDLSFTNSDNGVQVAVKLYGDHLFVTGIWIRNAIAQLHLIVNYKDELSPYAYYRTTSADTLIVTEVSSTVPEFPNMSYCSQWEILRDTYIQFCSFLKELVQSDDEAQHQVAANLIRILDL